jgi:bifunctional UDP-N-acetylglucosamine pyrophosphorylase/glucosamine-1-phosphate N-acetyltransferase
MTGTAFIVLAAGMGTRMKSAVPKVLHKAGGRSMLGHVLSAVNDLEPERVVVVVSPDADAVSTEARKHCGIAAIAAQAERLGTAHAASMARNELDGFSGTVVVCFGDVPLIQSATLNHLVAKVDDVSAIAVLGFEAANPHGYGRLVRNRDGALVAIREELDASDEERRITLCNSGVVAARAKVFWDLLSKISNDNAQGEYYLTDIVELANSAGHRVCHAECPEEEVQGVNDRVQLAEIEAKLQARYRRKAMLGGATLVAPETVFLSHDTIIGRDVTIGPNVVFLPGVSIGDGSQILGFCHLEGAEVGNGCAVGPYARLRPGTRLQAGSKAGNFVEIKNAVLEDGAKVNHLTYIGDARVGEKANVGAGTITCNYDGYNKHHTDIGAGAFIGSNSSLVAPVKIGDGAYVGSGSVVTKDVSPDALAVARGRQEERPGWAARYRAANAKSGKK